MGAGTLTAADIIEK